MWQARIGWGCFGASESLEARPAAPVVSLGVQMRDRADETLVVRCGRTGGPEVYEMASHTAQRIL